jgi:hypothetical protein
MDPESPETLTATHAVANIHLGAGSDEHDAKFALFGDIGNTGNVKKAGEIVIRTRRAGPGVCAAASPGDGGQRKEGFSSAGEQVGDPMAKIETPG